LIHDLHERLHFTGIIATHEIPKVFDIVNKVAIIQEGVIMAAGTPEEITTSTDPLVESFIQGIIEEPLT
jgi:phospholipid/cholesterol/gamma-HCH transport system ATP-binding protein